MKKAETKKALRNLFAVTCTEAAALKQVSETLYFLKVNQAIGVMRAAEALELDLVPDDRQEPDHPDTLLPLG
jgi:hypothetical protein